MKVDCIAWISIHRAEISFFDWYTVCYKNGKIKRFMGSDKMTYPMKKFLNEFTEPSRIAKSFNDRFFTPDVEVYEKKV